MNKTAIKTFAVRARIKLIQDITQKAYELGITQDEVKSIETFEGGFKIKGLENSKIYKTYQVRQREKLATNIEEKGFDQVVEEVAYTWFNRFIALRFMEVNEYLPTGVRVLSSIQEGKTEPDIIREVLNIDLDLDTELVYKLIDADDTVDLYKYLLIKQCNQLGEIMPMVFESISDYTELLLPDNLIDEGSVVRDLVESIEEEDYKDQVEIIGWMYQYYISEKKDEVFTDLKKNIKITKENIPAATQLFTPKWIVKYMVENSLGRLWLESHPDEDLQAKWKYYLEEAEQDSEVKEKLDELKDPNLNPEDIKILDPSMGSGHILVYAFDVLYDIYLKANYSERDIPQLILVKNLYGLDIDDRAGQLAAFALMMKARSKNRRIFRRKIELNICSIQETNTIPKEAIDFLVSPKDTDIEKMINRKDVDYLIEVFHDAKEYGSILDMKEINFDVIERRIEVIKNGRTLDLFEFEYREIILEKLPQLVKQGRVMSSKYDVICTNPPYMGSSGMNVVLSTQLNKQYSTTKRDLSTVFMEKGIMMLKEAGFLSMINIPSWMFISAYYNFREYLIDKTTVVNMLHLGRGIFGSDFGTTAFVIRNRITGEYIGSYRRLFEKNGKVDPIDKKKQMFFSDFGKFKNNQENFTLISGKPLAYWMTEKSIEIFKESKEFNDYIDVTGSQHKTANNKKYLRRFWEVEFLSIGESWINYAKGGEFRRWYGNISLILDWSSEAKKFYKTNKTSNMLADRYLFREGITWSASTAGDFSARFLTGEGAFDMKGPSLFPLGEENENIFLAFLNTKVTKYFLDIFSDRHDYQIIDIKRIPYISLDNSLKEEVNKLSQNNISISKNDWDSREVSLDFRRHPLLANREKSISVAFNKWASFTESQFYKLKKNEEKLNEIFIDLYELQEELSIEVKEKDISINKADREKDVKSFISYAVGCIFGRYSLKEEGIIYAGGKFGKRFSDVEGKIKINTTEGWKDSSFDITMDNILMIADDDYFEDDIVNRFIDFLKITFGEEKLEENLDYIAETLKRKSNETSRQAIRRYFLKDFYKDHVRTYKKTPIYWLFDSGKQNGFKALIYMHRYDASTVARVRTDYLHKLQKSYEAEVSRLNILLESDISPRDKAAAMRKKDIINKQIIECAAYDQVIAHVANSRIEMDLDDGVKVNYAKFQGIKVSQGEGKKVLTQDLLAKI